MQVAAPRRLIVSNELISDDGDDGFVVVGIFFFASFFFCGLWKRVGARSDRGLDCSVQHAHRGVTNLMVSFYLSNSQSSKVKISSRMHSNLLDRHDRVDGKQE